MENTDIARKILEYLESRKEEMTDFLHTLAEKETPSTDLGKQDEILKILEKQLQNLEFNTLRKKGKKTGGYLFARPVRRKKGEPIQMLVGHCDTVWPVGTLKEMPLKIENGRISGPGVYDMKAGLTQIVFGLRTLKDLGLKPSLMPVVLINSDEEIGSKESTNSIRRMAKIAKRAFILEPPLGLDGKLKTARKGLGRFTLTIYGQAAHAGLDPGKGVSAIVELSHQIQELFKMNDPQKGISVNVGMIEGGISANVIAPESRAVIDVRVLTQEDADYISTRIYSLEPLQEGISIYVDGHFGRPPMEPTPRNRALWDKARENGKLIGLELEEATAGGGSDGNTTSQFTATLDGLGTVGDGAHASHEFALINKMIERTALLVLLLIAQDVAEQ